MHADRWQCCLLLNTNTFAGWVTGSLYHNVTGIFFWSLANHKYDLCSVETWMLNKSGKSFMQPMKVCLPWLNSYKCHTQLYAGLWKDLCSYISLVDLCVWILFIWYQKVKVSCMMDFRDEGTFEPTTEMLIRESRTNLLIWKVIWVYPTKQSFLSLCHRTHLYWTIWHSADRKTHWKWTCFETCCLLRLYAA
jgi:hypothetical protein